MALQNLNNLLQRRFLFKQGHIIHLSFFQKDSGLLWIHSVFKPLGIPFRVTDVPVITYVPVALVPVVRYGYRGL